MRRTATAVAGAFAGALYLGFPIVVMRLAWHLWRPYQKGLALSALAVAAVVFALALRHELAAAAPRDDGSVPPDRL